MIWSNTKRFFFYLDKIGSQQQQIEFKKHENSSFSSTKKYSKETKD